MITSQVEIPNHQLKYTTTGMLNCLPHHFDSANIIWSLHRAISFRHKHDHHGRIYSSLTWKIKLRVEEKLNVFHACQGLKTACYLTYEDLSENVRRRWSLLLKITKCTGWQKVYSSNRYVIIKNMQFCLFKWSYRQNVPI